MTKSHCRFVKIVYLRSRFQNDNLITAAMQRQKFDILAGWNILGARCLECDSYMLLSSIASTRSPRTKGLGLPMSARGWNDRFRPSN
jgi:hypothetical protein